MEIMWFVVMLKILELDALDLGGQVWPLYQRSDELFCASGLSVFMILDLLEETISICVLAQFIRSAERPMQDWPGDSIEDPGAKT